MWVPLPEELSNVILSNILLLCGLSRLHLRSSICLRLTPFVEHCKQARFQQPSVSHSDSLYHISVLVSMNHSISDAIANHLLFFILIQPLFIHYSYTYNLIWVLRKGQDFGTFLPLLPLPVCLHILFFFRVIFPRSRLCFFLYLLQTLGVPVNSIF